MAPKDYKKRSPTEKKHSSLMADAIRQLEFDVLSTVVDGKGLPDDWQRIAANPERTGFRDKITLRLDREVIKFFKAMGPGYQMKIARVLRAWMHGRLAKVIEGPDTTDLVLRPEVVAEQLARLPYWGEDDAQTQLLRFLRGYTLAQKHQMDVQTGEQDPEFYLELEKHVMKAALEGMLDEEEEE